MPFGFLFRWSEEMQVGGLMPDEGPTVPSRLAIYLRQCCTEGQAAIIARQVEPAHRFRVTDHSMMRILEEPGHRDRKRTRLNSSKHAHHVCRLLLEKKKIY